MAPRRNIVAQDNFSGGAFTVTAGYLLPEEAVLQIENGLLDDQGVIYRRGGTRYASATAFDAQGVDRVNLATNPKGATNTTGWSTDASLTRGTAPSPGALPSGVTTAFLFDNRSSGTRCALPFAVEEGETYVVSLYGMLDEPGVGAKFHIEDEEGSEVEYGGFSLTTGEWNRDYLIFTAEATDTYELVFAAANVRMYFTAILIEKSTAPEPDFYFDGDVPGDYGAVWTGTANASTSEHYYGSPLTWLWDGEMVPGRRKLFASSTAFGTLDASDEPVTVGNDGLDFPVQAAYVAGLLFIGGGYIYGGSRRGEMGTATVGVTEGSPTVTGSNLDQQADPGSLFQIGNERVYVVETVTSSQITLTEPYEGSTNASASGKFHSLYKITANDPYVASPGYAVCVGRLLVWDGAVLRFSGVNAPHSWGEFDFHEVPGEEIIGVGVIQQEALIFTDQGTWTLSNLAYNIVDAQGTPQHRLAILSRDLILWHGAGLASWDQALVVPAIDAVWVLDGVSSPLQLTKSVERRYRTHVKRGHAPGKPAVYQGHLLLPILSASASPRDLMVCRLDAPYGEEGTLYPWSWFSGQAGEVAALSLEVGEENAPRLLAADTRASARLLDMTPVFSPSVGTETDADGSTAPFLLETRVYPTGDGTKNQVRSLRTRYTLRSESGGAQIRVSIGEEVVRTSGPKIGFVKFGEFQFASATTAFTSLSCHLPEDASGVHRCRVNEFWRFIRVRYYCPDPTSALTISGVELSIRPSRAVRR